MPRAFTHCSAVTSAGGKFEAWHFNGARGEAKCLIRLLDKSGNTLDSIRELIRVAPEEEAALRAFAFQHPEMAEYIERALRYRLRAEEEFESLVSRNTRVMRDLQA